MSEPIHQLPIERMRAVMRKHMRNYGQSRWDRFFECNKWANWKASEAIRQRRQRWLYAFVTVTVLALIGWLVCGGCR